MYRGDSIFQAEEARDELEVKVRLVCGALLGVLVAFCFWMRLAPLSPGWLFALFLGSICICAVCAVRFGNAFWYALRLWIWYIN
jgi:hypothetical protein